MSKTIQFNGTITIPDDLLPQDIVNVFKLETNTQDARCYLGYSPAPAPKLDLGKYAGRFVFVEQVQKPGDTDKTYSTYNNGEYFCFRSTPNTLYLVKYQVGYYGAQQFSFNIFQSGNSTSYEVLSSYVDDAAIQNFIKDQEKWLSSEKKQYVEYVYSQGENILSQVKRSLENRQ